MYPEGPNIEELKAAAKSGGPKAAYDLGWCYYIGNGVVQDTAKAWKWYSEAAHRGVREADDILHILEAEVQRASELKSLGQREKQVALRGQRAIWLAAAVLVLVSIGSVGTLLYVLDRKSTGVEEGTGMRGDKAAIREQASESKAQGSHPNSLSRQRAGVLDINDIAGLAEKWLEEAD